ncbi:MAG TPA: hypothetical protein VF081_12165 [Solirubrobacterales bacterium]
MKTSLGGAHMDKYFNSDLVLASPELTAAVVTSVLTPELKRLEVAPDWVISYAPYGLFVAHAVASAIGTRCAYGDPAIGYETHFEIASQELVLIVADDINSGRSVVKMIEQVEILGARAAPIVFCLANLSGASRLADREIVSAVALDARRFKEEACPLCDEGSPALLPRPNWNALTRGTYSVPG